MITDTSGITPVPCHSHNDYFRDHPLTDALSYGCISVEGDVWVQDKNAHDLYIGHEKSDLKDAFTLKNLYLEPLRQRLESMNAGHLPTANPSSQWKGVFREKPTQTLTLLIDFKTESSSTWRVFMKTVEPLRQGGWLSSWDDKSQKMQMGAITLVVSGNAALHDVESNKKRDVFLDCPLTEIAPATDDIYSNKFKYGQKNCFYASADYTSLSAANNPILDTNEAQKLKQQVADAERRGLRVRYWNTPKDDSSMWSELWKYGVRTINTDHLATVRKWFDENKYTAR